MLSISCRYRFIRIVKKELSECECIIRDRMQRFLKMIQFFLNLKNNKFSIVIQSIWDSRIRFIIDENKNENEIERSNILTIITSREFCSINNSCNNCEEFRNANKTTSSFLQQDFHLRLIKEVLYLRFEIQCKTSQWSQTRLIDLKFNFKSIAFHLSIYATR
jgi:hypothetical protein